MIACFRCKQLRRPVLDFAAVACLLLGCDGWFDFVQVLGMPMLRMYRPFASSWLGVLILSLGN